MNDLSFAIAAPDGLLDYKLGNLSTSKFKENKSEGKNENDNGAKFKPKADDSQSKTNQTNKGCFICDGQYRAKDTPKHEALNAIVDDESGKDIIRVNPLQLLNAIRVENTLPTRTSDSFGGMVVFYNPNFETQALVDVDWHPH